MPRLCRCGAIASGKCVRCRPGTHAQTTTQRGYDHAWRKLSEYKRTIDPLCELCEQAGKVTPATEVHHIRPIADAPELRLEPSNLMSTCTPCHIEIDAQRRRQTARIARKRGE